MAMQNEPRPLVDWVNTLRPRAQQAQQQFQTAVTSGGNFQAALNQYNDRVSSIRQDFLNGRAPEYLAAREVQQQPNFAAEIDSVGQFDARRSDNQYAQYSAPARMNYADIHLNEVSRYGDASSSVSVAGDQKSVTVHLNARSLRGSGQGRSRVEVSPVAHWEFDDANRLALEEWTNSVASALSV